LATGKNVYLPKGTYRISKQIVVGNSAPGSTAQQLRGDGLGTILLMEANFDPTASSVVYLQGAEGFAATVRDLHLLFAQPVAANDRSKFVSLGTSGAGLGLAGIKYPPAIMFAGGGVNNRFKIFRIRMSNCWQGIFQAPGFSSGGWWMEDIEVGAYECGLQVGGNFDMSHIKGWHHWYFNMTAANQTIMKDGLSYCMRLGVGDQTQSVCIEDVSNFTGRISIDNGGSMIQIANLVLDGDNAGLEVINSLWVHVANCYSTCSTPGPTSGKATFTVSNGKLSVVNHNGWCGKQGFIDMNGGRFNYIGGLLQGTSVDVPIIQQTGGVLRIADSEIYPTPVVWTVPVITVTGGVLIFTDNIFGSVSVGDAGGLVISADSASHIIADNLFNGWDFTPPGVLGTYQTGSDFYSKTVTAGSFTARKTTGAATAPGAGFARLAFVAGTNAGTGKLVAYAGTSVTPVTIIDNIGAGF
jgi:hypothetical protein